MLPFQNILFDFDGTLMDSSEGVFASLDFLAARYGLKIPQETYPKTIGPPLPYSFRHFLGFTPEQIPEAMAVYRQYYAEEGLFRVRIYDGIPALLQRLRVGGRRLFVTTSKPEEYARRILEKKELARFFDFTGGSDLEESVRAEKKDIIRYVLDECRLDPADCLMVGDRNYDVTGAAANAVKTAGVLYGFGSRGELEAAGAAYICATPAELGDLILGAS